METFDRLSKNPKAKHHKVITITMQMFSIDNQVYQWDGCTSGGNNWGTDVDGASGSIILNGTDGSSTDGDNIVLDATDQVVQMRTVKLF